MSKMFDLSGKVGLVTGGNSGIGLGFAEGLAQNGADVCIWGTNPKKNEAAVEQLKKHGTKVEAMICDVGEEEQIEKCFAATIETFGKVDSCFANAGIGSGGSRFAETTLENWRRVFQVNMEGVFLTFRAAVRHMTKENIKGSLVVTSSGTAIFGAARSESYASTKAGVIAMIRGLAVEYGKYGIRANAIIPGWIDTAMTAGAIATPAFQNKVLTRIPHRRWGVGSDFSGIGAYLASDASAYHSGDVIVIDGAFRCF